MENRAFYKAMDIYNRYKEYKKEGFSDSEIAAKMGFFRTDKDGNCIGEPSVSIMRCHVALAKKSIKAMLNGANNA